jgi:hypothetical protein
MRGSCEILREAPEHRMAAATRRAVLMRFAHAAAHRLRRLKQSRGARGGGQARSCSSLHFSIFGNLSL